MNIGVPKEIKNNEFRVAITPGGARELAEAGNKVYIQKRAGIGSGFSDKDYLESGCSLLDSIEEVYKKSKLIVKVKEPIKQEYELINENHIIFSFS